MDSINLNNLYHDNILPNGNPEITVEFLRKINELMLEYIKKSTDRKEKILNFQFPHELRNKLNLDIHEQPLALQEIINDVQMAMDYSIKTAHPRNFNQISQGVDLISLAGEWVTATTNTNMFTYEVAPFYNMIEKVLLNKMSKLCGWTEPCDGIFNPGGSISNLYAVQAALHYFFPNAKKEGLFKLPKLIIFTSAHSHYSMHRTATILGLGLDNVREVPVDSMGKLIPEKLEEMVIRSIKASEMPFIVACTAGTTVLGAFDPIETVSLICDKYNLWLHVDAAWGGGALVSNKYKHLLNGIEKADSVTWNPHKLMGALLQCSTFLIKKPGLLLSCNEMNAQYLFQQDKHYDINYDTGDKTIQCGRHVDVFKFWLMWRAKGDFGFEAQLNRLWDLANLLCKELRSRKNFEMVLENPEFTNVCFWYIPESIYKLDRGTEEFKTKLNRVAPRIKERMMLKGSLMIGYQPLDHHPNFFRMIFSNPATKDEDVFFLLNEIEQLGKDL